MVFRLLHSRGSTDAIKQVNQLITLLINDPNQDINQLLPKCIGVSSSSSTHKRHVSSSHDPTPSILPLETFEVAIDALPAKGNPTATSASAVAAPTGSTGTTTSRVTYRKGGSLGSIPSVTGSGAISSAGAMNLSSVNRPVVSLAQPSTKAGGGQNTSAAFLTHSSGENTRIPSSSLPDAHRASEPSIIHASSRLPTILPVPAATVKPASSGAVRRLFTSAPQAIQQVMPVVTSSSQASLSSAPTLTKASLSSASGGGGVFRTVPGHGMSIAKPVGQVSSRPPQPSKVQTRAHEATAGSSSNAKLSQVSIHTAVGEKAPPLVKTSVGGAMSMSYSRVINAAPTTASGLDTGSAQPHPLDVIEQPLQQIMKTPTIFQDPATQLGKTKKKSTYSDAVGKKSGASGGVVATGVGVAVGVATSGSASSIIGIPPPVASSGVTGSVGGSGAGGGALVLQAPPSSQTISIPPQNPKMINRAPGTRPVGEKVHGHACTCTYMYMVIFCISTHVHVHVHVYD